MVRTGAPDKSSLPSSLPSHPHAAHFRDIVASARRVSPLGERTNGAQFDYGDGGHLQTLDTLANRDAVQSASLSYLRRHNLTGKHRGLDLASFRPLTFRERGYTTT